MRGGDIGNEIAPAIGMRFERVLRTEEGKLNRSAKAYLESVGRSIDLNIYIITTADHRKALSFLMKWAVPFNHVIQADSTLEIPDICREHDLLAYYDFDLTILQNVNSRGSGKVEAKQWTAVEVS